MDAAGRSIPPIINATNPEIPKDSPRYGLAKENGPTRTPAIPARRPPRAKAKIVYRVTLAPMDEAISGSLDIAIPILPNRVLVRSNSKSPTTAMPTTMVMICCHVNLALRIETSRPLSRLGNGSDDVPHLRAASDSRMMPTPRVLTNQAKLNRSKRSSGRTAMKYTPTPPTEDVAKPARIAHQMENPAFETAMVIMMQAMKSWPVAKLMTRVT